MKHSGNLLSIYLCTMSGSTRIERDLAKVKSLASGHCNAKGQLLTAMHEVAIDGPVAEKELANEDTGEMTDLCRELCRLWLQRHGRRFRSYKVREDKDVLRGHRKNSEAALVSAQAKGREALLEGRGQDKSLLGLPASRLRVEPAERSQRCRLSTMLQQFHKTTRLRRQQTTQQKSDIAVGKNPYPVGDLRVGHLYSRSSPDENDFVIGRRGRGDVKVLNLCGGQPLNLITGAKLHLEDMLHVNDSAQLLERCKSVKLVLVEQWCSLDHQPSGSKTSPGRKLPVLPLSVIFRPFNTTYYKRHCRQVALPARSFAVAALAVAFLGLPVSTRDHWQTCAALDGPNRRLVVRRHKAAQSQKVAVVFSEYMIRMHCRIVDFIKATKGSTGISVLDSARDAPRNFEVIMLNGVADAFTLVSWVRTWQIILNISRQERDVLGDNRFRRVNFVVSARMGECDICRYVLTKHWTTSRRASAVPSSGRSSE